MNLFLNILFAYFVASLSIFLGKMELSLSGFELKLIFLFSLLPVLSKFLRMPILDPVILKEKFMLMIKEEGKQSLFFLILGIVVSFLLGLIGSDFQHAFEFTRKMIPIYLYISFTTCYAVYAKKHNL